MTRKELVRFQFIMCIPIMVAMLLGSFAAATIFLVVFINTCGLLMYWKDEAVTIEPPPLPEKKT